MGYVASAIIAAAALGYGIYSGERADSQQTAARRRQKAAQDEALRTQMIERGRTVQAEMEQANRPSPASTISLEEMLSGTDQTGGVDDRLRLSRPTKLGGG